MIARARLGRLVALLIGARIAAMALAVAYLRSDADWFQWKSVLIAIHVISPWWQRPLIFLVVLAVLIASARAIESRWRRTAARAFAVSTLSFAVAWLVLRVFDGVQPVVVAAILGAVWALDAVIDRAFLASAAAQPRKGWSVALVVIAELLFLKRLCFWLVTRSGRIVNASDRVWRLVSVAPVAAISAGAIALGPGVDSLASVHRWIAPDPSVIRLATIDLNSLALDTTLHRLYVGGHGTRHIFAYDTTNLAAPPLVSPVDNGAAEGSAYNPIERELYVHDVPNRRLLILDAQRLGLARAIPIPDLSPGDACIVWDRHSDSIVLGSEADLEAGTAFVVVDRRTGAVTDTQDIAPGFVMTDPAGPRLYLNLFRRGSRLFLYDLPQRRIVRDAPLDNPPDRMAIVGDGVSRELLVTSPTNAEVLRYDAATFQLKGRIPTVFGARAIAVDHDRGWILTGSLVNNRVEIIDLANGRSLRTYYVGPWLREIVLDTEAGMAYVSSRYGLFAIRYAPATTMALPAGSAGGGKP